MKSLIYGYKYGTVCSAEMSAFKATRLAADGGAGNPEASEGTVSNFLQCMHDVTKHSKANCAPQYASAYSCMRGSLASGRENECTSALADFAACRPQQ